MITFELHNLRFERSDPTDRFDLLLGVCADLVLQTEGRTLYSEPDFPVIELAAQLIGWCHRGLENGDDFEFTSMESDETGLVWFRRTGAGYRVGSLYQEFPAMSVHDPAAVRAATARLVAQLRERTKDELGIDIDPVLPR
jgi:hypothetical protein